jgi:hypothetical protein
VTIWDNGEGSNANPMATGRTETTDTLFALVSGIASNTQFMSGESTVLAGAATTGNVLAMRQLLSFLSGSIGNVTQNFLPEFIPGPEVVGYQELALSGANDAAE